MNANATNNANVEIMARLDPASRTPVVFLRSTIDAQGGIMVWKNGKEEQSNVDYYHVTVPLVGKDEEVMRQRYAEFAGLPLEAVKLNKRMPRTPRERTALLSAPAQQSADAAAVQLANLTPDAFAALMAAFLKQQAGAAPAAAPAEQPAAPALTLVHNAASAPAAAPVQAAAPAPEPQPQQEAAPRTRRTKADKKRARSEAAKKAAATRAANRARPLDAQPMPQGPQGDLPQAGETPAPLPTMAASDSPVVQATPNDVMQAIQSLGQEFNARLADIVATLQPKK